MPSPRASRSSIVCTTTAFAPAVSPRLTAAHPRLVSRAVLEDSRTPGRRSTFWPWRADATCPWPSPRGEGPIVFAFGMQDPGNLGAIVRVVEAAGGAGVIAAPGTADFFHPRAVRGSAGSVLRLPVSGRVSFEPFAADAKAAGRPLCGATSRRRRQRVSRLRWIRGPSWSSARKARASPRARIAISTAGSRSRCGPPWTL